jgi:signal transduction histidine kinase
MESVGTLAGGITHDFNNILSSIIGFTELALDETQKGTVVEDSLQEVGGGPKKLDNVLSYKSA